MPIIMPASVVKLDGEYLTSNSYSLTVSSDGGVPTVDVNISFGHESSDALTSLMEVVSPQSLLIGTVTHIDGDALIVSTPDGGSFRAYGTGVIGNKYYFKNQFVAGDAPTLADVPIVI
jgi:hypothetical protein